MATHRITGRGRELRGPIERARVAHRGGEGKELRQPTGRAETKL